MDSYSERALQESLYCKLLSRGSGFVPFHLDGSETVCTMFSRRAKLHPHKSAVVSDNHSLTYGELDQLSASIRNAVGLRRQQYLDSTTPIAVFIAKHTSFVAAMLGVLRSGGCYVPLDPRFPESRNAHVLRESKARIILTDATHQQLAKRLASPDQTLINIDQIEADSDQSPDDSEPDDIACILFTSGSTGNPKGVIQTHRNVLQVVKRYSNSLCVGYNDHVSLLSSFSVTASVATLLGSLLNGATLHCFSVLESGLNSLADWLISQRITLYDSAPSLFRHLMESQPDDRIFPHVQIVRLVSDSMYKSDWELFVRHFTSSTVLANHYGCSEISTASGFYMDKTSQLSDGVVPVGYPLEGVDILLIDEDGDLNIVSQDPRVSSPRPVGEIVLRSRYLSLGYWNNPDATAAAFSYVVGDSGVRVYRTGDLGAVRGDQGLVHLGRDDLQIKVSGFRIEIAEVEACLRTCPGVKEAAVTVHTPGHGDRELIGFVVMHPLDAHSGLIARKHLEARLPAYMVPSEVLPVDAIPCTPNGKLDRSALLALRDEAWKKKIRRSARTPTEVALSDMWTELLHLEQVGIDDDFFELNGNSLLAMRMLARIEETCATHLEVRTVLERPTIRQLAELIDGSKGNGVRCLES